MKYPALGVLLVMPSYCLMTCRHIICSVTKMRFDWRQLNPLWFLLFPLNKVLIPVFGKEKYLNSNKYVAFLKPM